MEICFHIADEQKHELYKNSVRLDLQVNRVVKSAVAAALQDCDGQRSRTIQISHE